MSTCETISIEVASAEASIGINADPITAFNFIGNLPADASFTPTPDNDILITPETVSYTTEIASTQEAPIGGIVYQQGINIQVGSPSGSIVPQLLTAYKYKFENYTLENPSLFSLGDVVFFGAGSNEYNTTLTKASVSNTGFGAYNNLFIFISYTGTTLEVMHKGYLEIPDSKIDSWVVGATIYLNASNKFHNNPTTISGHWVRSLGFCVPNNVNKKYIWFEPDSTYLKIN